MYIPRFNLSKESTPALILGLVFFSALGLFLASTPLLEYFAPAKGTSSSVNGSVRSHPDEVFLNLGLKPITPGQPPNVNQGDVIVRFDRRDMMGEPVANIQFTYVFGSLGAQCYELRIFKCLLMRHILYVHKWMA